MSLTKNAEAEIIELKKEIATLDELYQKYINLSRNAHDRNTFAVYRREYNRVWNKMSAKEDKIRDIEKLGISTKEKTSLLRESHSFSTISHDRGLGMRDNVVVVGFSKVLNSHVKFNIASYTEFMKNVRGMGSLAGKRDIEKIEYISEDEYTRLRGSS